MPTKIEDLVRQVECLEDYEQASQALMDVVHLEPATGGRLALNLLRSTAGDVHLRAFAFSMLYRANRAVAYEYARKNSGLCEAPVFLAMLGEVVEDVGLLNESTELQQVVADLRSAISHRTDSEGLAVKFV
ncbi:hypothetical protein [Roseateles sp. YR242]|uniref:hypothetical protein n=1 Tax=Roseateles sp. YR242 TaxID=1855305 RepID=UPI001160353D|nr:hypothetical protein [Roseateles sp. YR242]